MERLELKIQVIKTFDSISIKKVMSTRSREHKYTSQCTIFYANNPYVSSNEAVWLFFGVSIIDFHRVSES